MNFNDRYKVECIRYERACEEVKKLKESSLEYMTELRINQLILENVERYDWLKAQNPNYEPKDRIEDI